jgi:S-(hydroxymethyl)mycothiol dehydrogenase
MAVEREARGALLNAPGEPISVEPIVLDPPGPGEVQVRVEASGVCHSDLHVKETNGWVYPFPILLGHEAAGVIEEAGEGVTDLAAGDRVVVAWSVPCGDCPECRRGIPRRCRGQVGAAGRLHRGSDGQPLRAMLNTGTFADRTVVDARQAIKIPEGLPAEQACLIGCGVVTGVGAVLTTSPAWPGSNVVVIGCGGVGLSAVQGARIAEAGRIIAVDLDERKLDWAKRFGATDVVQAGEQDPVVAVWELTGKGADFVYDIVGRGETLASAERMLGYNGVATLVGIPAPGQEAAIPLDDGRGSGFFLKRGTLTVSFGGDQLPSEDFPRLAQYALDGKLDLGAMVSQTLGLDDVEAAFEEMRAGHVIRSVVTFPT